MTFPNDKVLTIEMTEKQISGRNISLNIDYEDVLSADSFNHVLLRNIDYEEDSITFVDCNNIFSQLVMLRITATGFL